MDEVLRHALQLEDPDEFFAPAKTAETLAASAAHASTAPRPQTDTGSDADEPDSVQ